MSARARPVACAAAALATLLLAGCDRAPGRVMSPAAENYSRNTTLSAPAGAEAPRDIDAAARTPPPLVLPTREAISDSVITAKIRAAMAADPGMNGADISVNTDHGVVVLTGTVKSHEQTGVASAYAQRQEGVMRVDTQVSIAPQ